MMVSSTLHGRFVLALKISFRCLAYARLQATRKRSTLILVPFKLSLNLVRPQDAGDPLIFAEKSGFAEIQVPSFLETTSARLNVIRSEVQASCKSVGVAPEATLKLELSSLAFPAVGLVV